FMDQHRFYVVLDTNFLIDFLRTEVAYLKRSWKALGRPTITFLVTHTLLDHLHNPPSALIATIKKIQSGYISGTRVHMGKLSDFLTTSCITQLSFLRDPDDPTQKEHQIMDFIDNIMSPSCPRPHLLGSGRRQRRSSRGASGMAISGIVRRSRSIQIDPEQLPVTGRRDMTMRMEDIEEADHEESISLATPETGKESGQSGQQSSCESSLEGLYSVSGRCDLPYADRQTCSSTDGSPRSSFKTTRQRKISVISAGSRGRARRSSTPSIHFVSSMGHRVTLPGEISEELDEKPSFSYMTTMISSSSVDVAPQYRSFVLKDAVPDAVPDEEEGVPGSDSSVPGSPLPNEDVRPFLRLQNIPSEMGIISPTTSKTSPTASPVLHRKYFEEQKGVDIAELLDNLKQSESLQEQADIIHYLYTTRGADWDTGLDKNKKCTVRDLLVELYEKAGHWKQWWLVRHTAGMLQKRVEDLAIAATDLLVRQKQLSVGMPPDREHIITCPLPPDELANIIYQACGEDSSSGALTQELLIYLAMFIRTEPKLFQEMLRLRVGLIIQVMASEMARTLKCTGDEASDHLMNLTSTTHHVEGGQKMSVVSKHGKGEASAFARLSKKDKVVSQKDLPLPTSPPGTGDEEDDEASTDRQGQWLRRRRLDGALNRVPIGFYPRIWEVLRRCPGLMIDDTLLPRSLTSESGAFAPQWYRWRLDPISLLMTKQEFKFALQVEMVLNTLPQPEYRQLMVEAMMVLTVLVENDGKAITMNNVIQIDDIVQEANRIFIEDQQMPEDIQEITKGAEGICQHLYDSAPSGRFGTMAYMCRALARILQLPVSNGALDCVVC
ncbi:hypothetical protein BaRGS_00010108, partial [Batillaria attramentaria]